MTTTIRKGGVALTAMLLMATIVTAGSAPGTAQSADHLDAPGLTSPGGDPRLDINDLYVFEGANPANTVLAVTVSPVAAGDSSFIENPNGSYHLRIDTNADGLEDITYSVSFSESDDGVQKAKFRRAEGKKAQTPRLKGGVIGNGPVETVIPLKGGGTAWAGLRSDPFFFDLAGFLGTVEGIGERRLGDTFANDFFDDLNTLAIVIEVPDSELGSTIGVWATTTGSDRGNSVQIDRIGRPAINTVVNSSGPIVGAPSAAKTIFNGSLPVNDPANFTSAVVSALQAYSSLDAEGAYADGQAAALAGVLLPDVITYNTSTAAAGPLNGRALDDDVIDIELRIVTGGDPLGLFDDRDEDGAINTDGVGPHSDYLSTFPYLGVPHS